MSVYLTKRDVNFGGKIIPAGSKVSLDEYDKEYVARLVEKGSVEEVVGEEVTHEAPKAPEAAPEAPKAPEAPAVEQPQAPVQPTVNSGDPTPEQIAQDLKDAGV